MSDALIVAILSLLGTMGLGLLGYFKLKRTTPLEQAQKIAAEVDTQSTILGNAWLEIDRLKVEIKSIKADAAAEMERLKAVMKLADADCSAKIVLLEAKFLACQKEFEAAKLAWATRELARNAEEKK